MTRCSDLALRVPRTWFADPVERVVRVSATALAQWLPLLGSVLYVPAHRAIGEGCRLAPNLLSQKPLLTPLLRTCSLRVLGTVSADGPREWIECLDLGGNALAQVHLLPDSDYLAWDNLPAGSQRLRTAAAPHGSTIFRGGAAHLMRFRCQSLAPFSCLGEASTPCVSTLGRRVATSIAGAQLLLLQGVPMLP